ncbi:GNAT family N-acetyltransferase [Caldimonas tepidiphila]|uniref:GNAT family N-acetyltransferase n=1 Tax=Caldimonas tepidiphila TaxID=2315841 RepID=UPI000E5B3904|nr:GNAT family N-acetyltransferase [Caldimonas tepidiphila]
MEIRIARADDAANISALLKRVAPAFTLHPQGLGAEAFLQGLEPEAVRGFLTAENVVCHVAVAGARLAGMLAIREHRHLFRLAVDPAFQGRGTGRALWRQAQAAALAAGNRDRFTVDSTRSALPFYERLGFRVTGPLVETRGLAFVPMELRLAAGTP